MTRIRAISLLSRLSGIRLVLSPNFVRSTKYQPFAHSLFNKSSVFLPQGWQFLTYLRVAKVIMNPCSLRGQDPESESESEFCSQR